jgi:hypothetical protein
MNNNDPIMDSGHMPTLDEIGNYIGGAAEKRWLELNQHLDKNFKVKQKTSYSTCSGKPGWNFKYQKSGKALCTLLFLASRKYRVRQLKNTEVGRLPSHGSGRG